MAAFYIIYPDVANANKHPRKTCESSLQSLAASTVTLECLFPRHTPYDLPLVLQDRSFTNASNSTDVKLCQCFGDPAPARPMDMVGRCKLKPLWVQG